MGKRHNRIAGASLSRRDFLRLAGAGLVASGIGFPAIVSAAGKRRNVIVLGIDGMDPTLLWKFIRAGQMPNAARLAETGAFSPLRTSNPPQSPVAWSNFISGTNEGGHGIFDFIARDPATMLPYLSAAKLENAGRTLKMGDLVIPLSKGKLVNLRGGPTFWLPLQERGVDCTVIRMPANFPPTATDARTLSGLGTPDIHGAYGIFSYYTTQRDETTREVNGGYIRRVYLKKNEVETELRGPSNSMRPDGERVNIPFKVYVDPAHPVVRIRIQEHDIVLREGEWSDWVRLSFDMVPHLVNVSGICRFFLKKARDPFGLYVSPVNIDPRRPALPISTPPDYARELAGRTGDFHTQGMPADTSGRSAGVLGDGDYRQQATFVLDEEMRMFESELARFREGLFFFYFCSLDLNSHMFWRTLDPDHPAYTAALAREHGDFLPWLYRRMDGAIGQALKRMDDQTLLIVLSDHGFGAFRRQFNLNGWLMDNGYVAGNGSSRRGETRYFAEVAWGKTRAYGLGINSLYLNLRGREVDGTVKTGAQADALKKELIGKLTDYRDPKNGEKVIQAVYDAARIYSGPFADRAPDLIVGYAPNYRASWDTVLGQFPREHVLDNVDPWSGDHTIDPPFMSGVLLANRKIAAREPSLSDLAPSILKEFGVAPEKGMSGQNVFA